MIAGLSHMTFIVSDLDRMTDIMVGVLGAREVYASGDETFSLSPEKFFLIGTFVEGTRFNLKITREIIGFAQCIINRIKVCNPIWKRNIKH